MKNCLLKAAACVPEVRPADPAFNGARIRSLIKEHADCGILVFPELSLAGYTSADLFQNRTLLAACEDEVRKTARAVGREQLVFVGVPVVYENRLYNCAAVLNDQALKAIVPKSYLPNYGEFYEQRWFTPGREVTGAELYYAGQLVPFGTDLLFQDAGHDVTVGCEICEDLWVPQRPSIQQCLAGAQIIVNLSASDETIGKAEYRRSLVRQVSADCWCGYVLTSCGAGESSTDLVFSGHTILAENGRVLQENLFDGLSHVETAVFDLQQIRHNRLHQTTYQGPAERAFERLEVRIGLLGGRETLSADELAGLLRKEGVQPARNPFVPEEDESREERCRQILQIQASGLATRLRATGIRRLVIGVSGGLDSTLALLVCHEACRLVPGTKILAYTMPSRGNTSDRTYENAVALMQALKVEWQEVPIQEQLQAHLQAIGHAATYQGAGDTAYENAQARIRTLILMDAANMHQGLVVGTGDLSELALGWCTYNGDHMSMYGVNASVPKTLVRYIVDTYARTAGSRKLKQVLQDIVATPITPELTPNQKGAIAQMTEAVIGRYDLNDFFLYWHLRYGCEPERILALAMTAYPEIAKEDLKAAEYRFFQRFFSQQFKRSCLPDGPKVGSVSLSPRGDWRMPSDASVQLWLAALKKA